MGNALIVSGDKNRTALSALVCESGYPVLTAAANAGAARRLLAQRTFEMVFINAPLPDESGMDLALYAARSAGVGVILLVRSEQADEVSVRVEDGGVFVVEKPLSRQLFRRAVKLVGATHRRMAGLRNENVRLQTKIDEIRLVGRAKCALIQYLGMSEEQAHRHIEKQAMDLRVTRREVAQQILNLYENAWS